MRTLWVIALSCFVIGCGGGTREVPSLSAEQASSAAQRLANEEAFRLYHCRPFRNSQAARFVQGRWVWADRQGFGQGDYEVAVLLAADGSTNRVELKLLDNRQHPVPGKMTVPGGF